MMELDKVTIGVRLLDSSHSLLATVAIAMNKPIEEIASELLEKSIRDLSKELKKHV